MPSLGPSPLWYSKLKVLQAEMEGESSRRSEQRPDKAGLVGSDQLCQLTKLGLSKIRPVQELNPHWSSPALL